jgi:hypothetical protein
MIDEYPSNEAFFAELRSLIDAWCDRRCLLPLSTVLPAFTAFNGLGDGYGELLDALTALSRHKDMLPSDEQQTVAALRQALLRRAI